MTMKTEVSCDYEGCCLFIELDNTAIENESEQIIEKGWLIDSKYQDFHYCKKHKHVLEEG